MIEITELRKVYGDGTIALGGINASIDRRITAVIGRNGAGKTTMMRILSTQLAPTSGTVSIDGLDVMKRTAEVRRKIASIPQEATPIGILTPIEHVTLYLLARNFSHHDARREALDALDNLGIREYMDKPADTLSGGTKRKIFVAMAIASNADTVFLDEPTTGLDPVSRMEVWSSIRKLEGNIIVTTHYMEEAEELSQEVFLVDRGIIIEKGEVKTLLARFDGKLRAESYSPIDGAMQISNTYVKYIQSGEVQKYAALGCTIKRITLDDIFINRGVDIES
ncbi:MAG: multidrug ABC transporter ATP-binding protein [Thermoplasmatales archaeon B_DKE]|nr:MAG: multidrug ABC transporter ATP-binding protein [Thermoplasmatales archaeon B_DKE]